MAQMMQIWMDFWQGWLSRQPSGMIYAPHITINMPWSGDVKQDMLNQEDDDDD